MKQFFYSILLFAMSYGMGLQAQSLDQPPVTEPILESSTPHLSPNRLDAMWDLEFDYDAAGALGYGALAGAYYFKDEFWVSQWNTDRLFTLDSAGNAIDTFSIMTGPTFLEGTRAMTADDTSIYIANNTNRISQIDPTTRTRIGAITTPLIEGQGVRFITYDPTADNGNGGFWVANFNTEIRQISRTGAVLQAIPATTHGLAAMYGAAFDGQSPGGPYLWVFHQNNGPSRGTITQLSLAKGGVPTLEIRDVASEVTLDPTDLAGGLFISDSLIAGKRILGGMLQSGILFGYDLDYSPAIYDAVGMQVAPSPAYTKVPEIFATPVSGFSAVIFNQGTTDSIDVDITISVDSAGSTIYTGMPTTATDLERYDRDTINVGGTFSPIGKGDYEIVATASAANGMEGDPSNDRAVFPYSINDSIYSRDNENYNATYNFFAAGYAGAIFDIPNSGYIKAIEVVLGTGARQTGDSIYAIASSVTAGFPDNAIALRGIPQIVSAFNDTYLLEFPVAIPVTPNTQWLFGIYKNDSISLAATTDYFEEGYNYFTGRNLSWTPSTVPSTRFIRPIIATCAGFRIAASAAPDNGTTNGVVTVNTKGAAGIITYQWNDPNNSTSATVTGLPVGTYTVTVIDQNGCMATDSATVTSNVSIEDNLQAGIYQWDLFPNPAGNEVHCDISMAQPSELQWELIDLTGKVLIEKESDQDIFHRQSFDVRKMAAGLYIIRIHTNKGSAQKRFIIQ